MTPDEVRAAAEAAYGGDGYDSAGDMVFVLLVDAAEQVERDLRAAGCDSLVLARLITFKALSAALEAREGDRRGDGAVAVSVQIFGADNAHDLTEKIPDGPLPDTFAHLLDVAWAYEQGLAAERGARMVDGDAGDAVSLAEMGGLTPRVTMLLGLMENLEMRDEEQRETPA